MVEIDDSDLREKIAGLRPEIDFIDPPNGRFWAKRLVKSGKLDALRYESLQIVKSFVRQIERMAELSEADHEEPVVVSD